MPYRTESHGPCDCCGGGGVSVTCCPDPLPTTLYLTVSAGGACDGTYALAWDGSQWAGSVGACLAQVRCVSGSFSLVLGKALAPSYVSCSPLWLTFAGVNLSGCGGGCLAGATVSVTT